MFCLLIKQIKVDLICNLTNKLLNVAWLFWEHLRNECFEWIEKGWRGERKNFFLSFFHEKQRKQKKILEDAGEADKETDEETDSGSGSGDFESLTRDGEGISLDGEKDGNSTEEGTEGVSLNLKFKPKSGDNVLMFTFSFQSHVD